MRNRRKKADGEPQVRGGKGSTVHLGEAAYFDALPARDLGGHGFLHSAVSRSAAGRGQQLVMLGGGGRADITTPTPPVRPRETKVRLQRGAELRRGKEHGGEGRDK